MDSARQFDRAAMSQENTLDFATGRHGDAVQDIVTVVEEDFGDTDETGVDFPGAKFPGKDRRWTKGDVLLEPPGERRRIEIRNRSDAEA